MKQTQLIMGMPITIEIVGGNQKIYDIVFDYFRAIDERFSTYKDTSEIMQINKGEIDESLYSIEMKEIFELARRTKMQTKDYFDIRKPDGSYDPSGIVKGWAIKNAAQILHTHGYVDFCLDVGGDIQTSGVGSSGLPWAIGIRNPFNTNEIIKVIENTENKGIATSGSYIRGAHIYNPHGISTDTPPIVSLTVIGPDIYEADRFATAAYAMGHNGIYFIEHLPGFEAYMIDENGIATMTTNFENYTKSYA